MSALAGTLLLASLLGSPHCVGMCGGFAWLAAGPQPSRRATLAYHGARLAGYTALGALVGLLGASVDRLAALAGLARLATTVAGTVMVLWGLHAVLTALGVRMPLRTPSLVRWPGAALLRRAATWPASSRAALVGAATALLPCGWLYLFVAAAAGTTRPLDGAALMLLFGAGTLPAFALFGLAAQRAAGPLRRHLPLVTGTVLLVLGAITATGRGPGAHHLIPPQTTHDAGHR